MTAAAQALYITQPTLSARLQTLEDEVGTPLFVRGKGLRRLELTDAGSRFLPLAQRTLSPTQLPLEQPLAGTFGVPLAVSCWLVLGMWALDRWLSGKSTGKRQKKRV